MELITFIIGVLFLTAIRTAEVGVGVWCWRVFFRTLPLMVCLGIVAGLILN